MASTMTASAVRPRAILAMAMIGLLALFAVGCAQKEDSTPAPLTFDGDSAQLPGTRIVPTLDTPIETGRNAIWCISFQMAWQQLRADVVREAIMLQGAEEASRRLNAAAGNAADLPEGASYAKAGFVGEGILQTIDSEMRARFPDAPPPTFPALPPDAAVAYAWLQAQLNFPLPYFDSREPMVFTGNDGRTASIRAFGIEPENVSAIAPLREQPRVLYIHREDFSPVEFAVDLCGDSQPSQIVLAVVERKETLAATLEALEKKIASMQGQTHRATLGPNDTLLVPNFAWRINHRVDEVEGKAFQSGALAGRKVDMAVQMIQFRLDRSGMALRSEAKIAAGSIPTRYHFDRPFLLYAKKRGAERPYLVMWVENDELFQKDR